MIGCTSTSLVHPDTESDWKDEVHVGDHAEVMLKNGKVFEVDIEKVDQDSFIGKDTKSTRYRFKQNDVASVSVTRTSTGKTVGLIASVLGAVAVVVAIVLVANTKVLKPSQT
jgi:hypothetical protein